MAKTCSHYNCSYPVFSKGLCMSHWRGKYATRIPAYKSVDANNSIPKISNKHAAELKIYYQLRDNFLKERTECEIRKQGCWIVATQVHHDRGRGKYLLVVSTWKAVCSGPCHGEITDHSKEAIEDGHSHRRNTPIERTIFHNKDKKLNDL